jgi:hypothetical protein
MDGCSPLYAAASKGHAMCAKVLLERGANVDHCMEGGCTPLWIALQSGHHEGIFSMDKNCMFSVSESICALSRIVTFSHVSFSCKVIIGSWSK